MVMTLGPAGTLLSPLAVPAGAHPLKESLISWWKLDEASGTRADSHGTNHLTDNNTVTQAAGKVGSAGQFTAANSEYLSIADNASLSTGDIDFTLAGWVYFDIFGSNRSLAAKGAGVKDEYIIQYQESSQRFIAAIWGTVGGYKIATGNALGAPLTATWYFVVGWHDAAADTVNIQINDGTVDSTATAGVAPSDHDSPFHVGAYRTADYHNGRIDEVAFWKRVLTADERAWLYNSSNGRTYEDL